MLSIDRSVDYLDIRVGLPTHIYRQRGRVNRQRGRVVRSVVFTTAMIARLLVLLVVASLDKMLYDNYLCLVKSNKQQIEEVRGQIQAENLETRVTPK